ncbi:hypothetical protein PAP_04285 [Palaeococcus pacificus DY20341]|uniref:Uncharacterized protein n=1 Tax=Palaeococcus pacificus DY20341 TaxID=1343739 RepID=A0A075LT22_9EURY|nr:hypothetical protein PAP_04285 [Palaeococcus pacificus DY20341]
MLKAIETVVKKLGQQKKEKSSQGYLNIKKQANLASKLFREIILRTLKNISNKVPS